MTEENGSKKRSRFKLGEMLVKYRVITQEQLEQALHQQQTVGGRLGRNLLKLNFITEDVFIKFLAGQLGLGSINLNDVEIPAEVQGLIPLETVKRLGILPVRKDENTLILGMTDPSDLNVIKELEFSLGCAIRPVVLAESQWEYAIRHASQRGWGTMPITRRPAAGGQGGSDSYDLTYLVRELIACHGSDLHLSVGVEPTFRVDDHLVRINAPQLTEARIDELLDSILTPSQREELIRNRELDFAVTFPGVGRFRVNIYRQKGCHAAALRHILDRIPSLEELNLPSWLPAFIARKQGLILITGPSGHGKSTTMACLLDLINSTRRVNVVTIEDPIEYVHYHKNSNVNQREIGSDTDSFREGIKHIFRQDPDVIAFGEIRDLESISTALTAAETGHLVLATLHTLSAVATIDRLIDVFPSAQQNQVRSQLAAALLLVFSQRLVPRADGAGRVVAYEKLVNSYRVQNAIRENRAYMLRSQGVASGDDYSSIEYKLAELVRRGIVSREEALRYAEDQKVFETLLGKK
jgi:twitching motility protein PilT